MAASASTSVAQSQDNRTFKEKSEVLADSIRSKGMRFGKKVADGSVEIADSVKSKAPRVGKKIKRGAETVGDSIESKFPRVKEKTVNAADSVAARSKRAWNALRGK